MKMPERGFSNVRFRKAYDVVNLEQIDRMYEDGEVVNLQTLAARGYLSGKTYGIKVLGKGELTKKVTLEIHDLSESAREKLQQANIVFTIIE